MHLNFTRALLLASGLSTVAVAAARDQPGFDATSSSSLQGIPVEIVLYTDHLRVQTPFMPSVFDDALLGRTDVVPGYKTRPTPYTEGALAQAWRASMARAYSKPAVEVLDAAHCYLPVNDDLMKAVESAIRPAPWAGTSSIQSHVLADGQKPEDVVSDKAARYVIELTYSLSPDLSYVMISGDNTQGHPLFPTGVPPRSAQRRNKDARQGCRQRRLRVRCRRPDAGGDGQGELSL